VFYSRMKGRLEEEVMALGLASCNILRPGILDGDRKESRPSERFALGVLRKIPAWTLPASARPVHVTQVARACIHADLAACSGTRIFEAGQILATV